MRKSTSARWAKDEMFLLEHSFSSPSTSSRSCEPLVFNSTGTHPETGEPVPRRTLISFNATHKQPTVEDDEVYVALLAITQEFLKGRPVEPICPRIPFTRYQILETLRWADKGQNYAKVIKALYRLAGTLVECTNSFYDKASESYGDAFFHIIEESVHFTRAEYEHERSAKGVKHPQSWIRWGNKLYQNICAGNLAQAYDWDDYLSLKDGVAKKFFRYNHKRLYGEQRRYVIDLRELAEDKLGCKRNQRLAYLETFVRDRAPALKAVGQSVRIDKQKKTATVSVLRVKKLPRTSAAETASPGNLEQQLIACGITAGRDKRNHAGSLVDKWPATKIERCIRYYRALNETLSGSEKKKPGYLIASIMADDERGFVPADFKTAEERKLEQAEARKKKQEAAQAKKQAEEAERKAREEETTRTYAPLWKFFDSLSTEEQIEFEQEAWKCDSLKSQWDFFCDRARKEGIVRGGNIMIPYDRTDTDSVNSSMREPVLLRHFERQTEEEAREQGLLFDEDEQELDA